MSSLLFRGVCVSILLLAKLLISPRRAELGANALASLIRTWKRRMASKKTSENKAPDAPLALPALSLLAPPLRLVSAAMWKVMKQRDVMHYGTLEEFVTSSCEAVPGLLTSRHQAKLALGLRGRLILELCRGRGPLDPEAVLLQLERIRAPVPSSAATKRDVKVENTVRSFRELVHELLRDPAERELFNKEFPVDYGPPFDLELEKLLWEFLIRLDSLFPVPNFAQTVSWLSAAPAVLEECLQAPCQPQLLKTLLQHQKCLGHIESAASLPPCMGDSILISLSLPPSGRVPESHPSSARTPSCKSGPPPETGRRPEPVIGLMSNEDLPIMASANRRAGGVGVVSRALDEEEQRQEEEEESEATRSSRYTGVKQRSKGTDDGVAVEQDVQTRRSGTKRPLGDAGSESEEEEEEAVVVTRRGRKRRSLRDGESGGEEESVSRTEGETCTLPDDPEQRRLALRCRQNDRRHRPRVLVRRLSLATYDPRSTSDPGAASRRWDRRPGGAAPRGRSCSPVVHDGKLDSADKENCDALVVPGSSPAIQRRSSVPLSPTGPGDDIIVDSEDEATKNFKGRLFMKRYHRTKNNTYVPTLREFWKARRGLLSPGNGHR